MNETVIEKGLMLSPREFYEGLCREIEKDPEYRGVRKPWHDWEGHYFGPHPGLETIISFSEKAEHQAWAAKRPQQAARAYLQHIGSDVGQDADTLDKEVRQIRGEHESFGTICILVPRRVGKIPLTGMHRPALTILMRKRDSITLDCDERNLDKIDTHFVTTAFKYWVAHRPTPVIPGGVGEAFDLHDIQACIA